MSWRKTRKEMHKVKKKFGLGVSILGLVAIILIALLCLKIYSSNKSYYSVKPRSKNVEQSKIIKDSNYKTIAWLRIQGTNVDMPIIWSKNENEEFPVELENYA